MLAGDSRAHEAVGQYRLADAVLDITGKFDVEEVITLGGFGTGEEVEKYTMVGVAARENDALKQRLENAEVRFQREDTRGNIVGMSGLLVGLDALRGFETTGLLGISHSYHVDPASARAVIEVLQEGFEFSVSLDTLDEQAEEIQQLLEQLHDLQQQGQAASQSGENLRYFG